MQIRCKQCGETAEVDDGLAGKRVRLECPCGNVGIVIVPAMLSGVCWREEDTPAVLLGAGLLAARMLENYGHSIGRLAALELELLTREVTR